MDTALRNYKNNCCGAKLSIGKGVGGPSWLTDTIFDHIQTYYGYAIRNNEGDSDKIVKAYCPQNEGTWTKYHKDQLNNTNTYKKDNCLPHIFREELKPIFDRLLSHEIFWLSSRLTASK